MYALLSLFMGRAMSASLDANVAALEAICARMKKLLVRVNEDKYFVDDDERLWKRTTTGELVSLDAETGNAAETALAANGD